MIKTDLSGKRFGRLTVLCEADSSGYSHIRWLCRCDCGNECTVFASNLTSGHTVSCGCGKENDLTGRKIGHLTVIGRSDKRMPRGKRTVPAWECLCDCGAAVYQATDTLTKSGDHMCAECLGLYAAGMARQSAGFVGGTQLSRIRDMTPSAVNTSGVRGVQWCKNSHKWRARLKFKGKLMNFGSYEKFEDAVAARKKAEEEYFGTALSEYSAQTGVCGE